MLDSYFYRSTLRRLDAGNTASAVRFPPMLTGFNR